MPSLVVNVEPVEVKGNAGASITVDSQSPLERRAEQDKDL